MSDWEWADDDDEDFHELWVLRNPRFVEYLSR